MSELGFHVKKDPAATESLKTSETKHVRELPKEQITKLPICFSAAGASTPGGGLLFPHHPGVAPPPPDCLFSVLQASDVAGGNRSSFLEPGSELLLSPVVSCGLSTLGAGHRQELLPWDSTCPAKNEPKSSDFLASV